MFRFAAGAGRKLKEIAMSRRLSLRLLICTTSALAILATVVFAAPSGAQSAPAPPEPFRSHVLPDRIEAEDFDAGGDGVAWFDNDAGNVGGQYRSDTAVDIYKTVGADGHTVGRTRDGEWMQYTVDVARASTFEATARVASGSSSPGGFELAIVQPDGTLDPIGAIDAKQTGWWKFETATFGKFDLGAGRHVLRLTSVGGNVNIDRLAFSTAGGPGSQVPFQVLQVPGVVEAEDFDEGGHNTAWFDTDSKNFGGAYRPGKSVDLYNISGEAGVAIGRNRGGEWTEYTVEMSDAGFLGVAIRVASGFDDPGGVRITIDGAEIGAADIDNTGGWWTWETVDVGAIEIEPGRHVVRVEWTGAGQINFDRIEFATGTPTIATVGGVDELKPVGKVGRSTIARCPSGLPALGVGGAFEKTLTAIDLACGRPDGSQPSRSLLIEAQPDGERFDLDCATGEVLVGVVARSVSRAIDGLRPICVVVSPYGNWGGAPSVGEPAGKARGKRIERRCPVNYAVVAVEASAGSKITGASLLCQRLTQLKAIDEPTRPGQTVDATWSPTRLEIDIAAGENRIWDGIVTFNEAAVGTLRLAPSDSLAGFIAESPDRIIAARVDDRVGTNIEITIPAGTPSDGDPDRCDIEGTITGTIDETSEISDELPVCINIIGAGGGMRDGFSDPSQDRLADGGVGRDFVVGELLVGLNLDLEDPDGRITEIAAAHGATVRSGISRAATYQLDFPDADTLPSLDPIQAQLRAEANVDFVSRVFVGDDDTQTIPDDEIWERLPDDQEWFDWSTTTYTCDDEGRNCGTGPDGDNWNLEAMGMPEAWDLTTGDPSVRIGIIDSGFNGGSAADLAPNLAKLTGREALTSRGRAHGENMSSIACAQGNNEIDMTGIAWDCQLYMYSRGGRGGDETMLAAMVEAVDDGVDIVSVSQARIQPNVEGGLAGCDVPLDTESLLRRARETNDVLERAIDYALVNGRDVLWVFSAANACRDIRYESPASLVLRRPETVMTIAAHDVVFEPQRVTNFGPGVTVAAPGEQITQLDTLDTDGDGDLHHQGNGTSSAAPHVAGLAALVKSYNPTFSAAQIKQCIVDGAASDGTRIRGTRLGDGVPEIDFGFNSVNAPAAIRCPNAGRGVDEPSDFQVLLYDDAGFEVGVDERTLRIEFPGNVADFTAADIDFNDKTSSVQWRIPEGFTLRLYEDVNFEGDELDLVGIGGTDGYENLDDQSFGDKASSAQWIQTSTVPTVRRISGPSIVGDNYQVTYEVANDSLVDAPNIVVSAPVRAGQFVAGASADCQVAGVNPTGQRTLTCTVPNVPAGESREFILSFKPTDASYEVALTLSNGGVLNNTSTTIIPASNAEIDLAVNPPVRIGDEYNVTFRITNTGSLPADTALTVPININQLPGAIDGCTVNGTNPNGARVLRCELGEIAIGDIVRKTLRFRVPLESYDITATATSARAIERTTVTIGAGSTSLDLSASAPTPIGSTFSVTFTATNTGNVLIPAELSIALNVIQLAEVPEGCELRGVNPDGARQLVCDLGTLASGATATQEIVFQGFVAPYTLTARVAGPDAADSVTVTIPTNAVAGLTFSRTSIPRFVDGDFDVAYRLSNGGRLTSLPISMTASLVAGQFVSATGATCSVSGVNPNGDRTLTCEVPPVNPGDNADFTIRFNGEASSYVIALTATTDAEQIGTVTTTIPAGTIGLGLSASEPAPSGNNYNVDFTATNSGTAVVPVELSIPLNISQLASTPAGCVTEGVNPNGDRTLRCDLGTLGSGASATQAVTFRSQDATYTLTARVDGLGESATASVTIPGLPAVDLVQTRISGPTEVNGDYRVGYRIRNNGGLPADDVTITAALQAGQYVSADGTTCVVSGVNPNGARTLTCDVANIAAGDAREFTVVFNGGLASYEIATTLTNDGTTFNTVTTTIPSGSVSPGLTAGDPVLSGEDYAVLFRATNNGTVAAPFDLSIPLNISQLASTPAGCVTEGVNPNGDRTLRCDLGTLSPGASDSQVVLFNSQAAAYTLTARVDTSGESASASFTIPSLPRVVVSVVGSPSAAGEVQLAIRNAGGGTVSEYILSGGIRVGQYESGGDCTVSGVNPDGARTLRCDLGALPSDGSSEVLDLDFRNEDGGYVVTLNGAADGVVQDDNVTFTIPPVIFFD